MLSDRLLETKDVEVAGRKFKLKKLPTRFKEWSALRLFELGGGSMKVKSFSELAEVYAETIVFGVQDWDFGVPVDRENAMDLVLHGAWIAEPLLKAIEDFNMVTEDEKKR